MIKIILLILTLTIYGQATTLKNNDYIRNLHFDKLKCDLTIDAGIYQTCYSYKYKGALAVTYTLDGSLVNKNNLQKHVKWHSSEHIPTAYAQNNKDYLHSYYDMGHMAPDASFDYDITSLKTTYTYGANSIPQASLVNRHGWADVELRARELAVKHNYVNVINIIKYSKSTIGNGIHVPSDLYKLIYITNDIRECYHYINTNNACDNKRGIETHRVNCDSICYEEDSTYE